MLHQGKRLKVLIRSNGFTQSEAAKALGMTRQNLTLKFSKEKLGDIFLQNVKSKLKFSLHTEVIPGESFPSNIMEELEAEYILNSQNKKIDPEKYISNLEKLNQMLIDENDYIKFKVQELEGISKRKERAK